MSDSQTSGSSSLFDSKHVIAAAIIGGVATVGALYYFSRKDDTIESNVINLAEMKKTEGIERYRLKKYNEAIQLFQSSIDIISAAQTELDENKSREIRSSCYNNIAACDESLDNFEKCIEHCSKAIEIKPKYTKALVRRARCYSRLSMYKNALNDYLDITDGMNLDQNQPYNEDMDRVAYAIYGVELEERMKEMRGKCKPISQYIVQSWLYSTVTNDPLLKIMETLDLNRNDPYDGVEGALALLKESKYDKVLDAIRPIAEDETRSHLERAQAILLSSRFLFFHDQVELAREMVKKFIDLWNGLDESTRSANKDLFIAYFTLVITIAEIPNSESEWQNLVRITEDALRINPKNADPLMALATLLLENQKDEQALAIFRKALKVDSRQPYAKFCELFTSLMLSLQQQNITQCYNTIFQMERAIAACEKPPFYALFLMMKIGMLFANKDIALDSAKKALAIMPNCSYVRYYYGLMDQSPNELRDQHKNKKDEKIKYIMNKIREIDPNYWEPYRILANVCSDSKDYKEAMGLYEKAIGLVRTKDELQLLLKDRLICKIKEESDRAKLEDQSISGAIL